MAGNCVEPIKLEKDIKLIKKHLADNARNLAIFVVGINSGWRASDLVRLTVGLFRGKSIGDFFEVREWKTRNRKNKLARRVTINQALFDAVQPLLRQYADKPDDWLLFQSRKGDNQPMTSEYLHYLVSSWCKAINLRGNYGSHTLRKTWGYTMRTKFNAPIEVLMHAYGHSSQSVTLRYICLQSEEIRDVYLNCI